MATVHGNVLRRAWIFWDTGAAGITNDCGVGRRCLESTKIRRLIAVSCILGHACPELLVCKSGAGSCFCYHRSCFYVYSVCVSSLSLGRYGR